ncbi:unnamed protein product [Lota lota]
MSGSLRGLQGPANGSERPARPPKKRLSGGPCSSWEPEDREGNITVCRAANVNTTQGRSAPACSHFQPSGLKCNPSLATANPRPGSSDTMEPARTEEGQGSLQRGEETLWTAS